MTDKVMLVAAGSRGIGAAIARLAAERGYDVAFTYVQNKDRADQVAETIRAAGRRALPIRADMADEGDILATFAVLDAEFGRLDCLIYNAGINGTPSRLEDAETSNLARVMDVNVLGAMIAAREAIRRMSTRYGHDGGSIVFMSSRAARYGSAGEYVWYAASKGAMNSLTVGLARELARDGIRVNAVSPGPIDTEMHRPGRLEEGIKKSWAGRAGRPEEVAEAALFLASNAASYVMGGNIFVAGGA